MKTYFSTFVLLFFLFSCNTVSYLKYEVMKPASYSYPLEIKNVLLLNNSGLYRDSTANILISTRDTFMITNLWIDKFPVICLRTLKKELTERNFFDSVFVDIDYGHKLKINKGLGQKEILSKLYERYGVDIVVVLDDYLYKTNSHFYQYLNVTSSKVFGAVNFSVYDCYNGNLLIKNHVVDTLSLAVYDINSDLKDGIKNFARHLAYLQADNMAPRWKTVDRSFFSNGDTRFIEGRMFVDKGNWSEAVKVWKQVYYSSEGKIKAQAAYNLSLAGEIMGDLDSALYWITKSAELCKVKKNAYANTWEEMVIDYKKALEKREKQIKLLKEQIGG